MTTQPSLTWLEPGEDFPSLSKTWGAETQAPGLLAAGGRLDTQTLIKAYSGGIFPWFSDEQPILWWSPNPRMVLKTENFRLHRSFKKTLQLTIADPGTEIRIDTSFEKVIRACAGSLRNGQPGTWIMPSMIEAYISLHYAGFAHSVETWLNGQLVGGLYFVSIGKAVFGESMFTRQPDASKIALSALVCLCRKYAVEQIDCQQNTSHLHSLGARELDRNSFMANLHCSIHQPAPQWAFKPLYWHEILDEKCPPT